MRDGTMPLATTRCSVARGAGDPAAEAAIARVCRTSGPAELLKQDWHALAGRALRFANTAHLQRRELWPMQ